MMQLKENEVKNEPAVVQNYLGSQVDICNYSSDQICVVSIINSLEKIPRFGGNTEKLYSVLHHTVLGVKVAKALGFSRENQKAYFLHDWEEGVVGVDLASPVKKHCPALKKIGDDIKKVIFDHYSVIDTPACHDLDQSMGYFEAGLLLPVHPKMCGWEEPRYDLETSSLRGIKEVAEQILNPTWDYRQLVFDMCQEFRITQKEIS